MNKKQGFTLIELMVVISIISLLSSVILASVSNVRKKAQDTKIKTQLTQMQTSGLFIYDNQKKYGTARGLRDCGATLETVFTNRRFYTSSNWPKTDNSISVPICTSDQIDWGGIITSYSLYFPLNNSKGFCVDSENKSIERNTIPDSSSCTAAPLIPNGATCTSNNQCLSGQCDVGGSNVCVIAF